MSFLQSLGDAWKSFQDTVAPPPPDKAPASQSNQAAADPYASVYARQLAAESGHASQPVQQSPAPHDGQVPITAPGSAPAPVSTSATGGAPPPVAFFSPATASAVSGQGAGTRKAKAPAARYVPVDDGFYSTAGHADRGAKYGNTHGGGEGAGPSSGGSGAPPSSSGTPPPTTAPPHTGHVPAGAPTGGGSIRPAYAVAPIGGQQPKAPVATGAPPVGAPPTGPPLG